MLPESTVATPSMPGNWDDVPRAIKREVARQLVAHALRVFGWPAVLKSLYVGRDDLGMRVSETYAAEPMRFWSFLVADATANAEKKEG